MTTSQAMFFLYLLIGGLIINALALIVNTVAIWVAVTQADRTLDRAQKHKDARKMNWHYFYDENGVSGYIDRGYESIPLNGYRYIIGQSIEGGFDELNNLTERIGHILLIIHPNNELLNIRHYNENINELFEIANYHYYEFKLEDNVVKIDTFREEAE